MLVHLHTVSFFPRLTAVIFGEKLNLIPHCREDASGSKCLTLCLCATALLSPTPLSLLPPGSASETHHFVVDLMEVDFTHFFHNVFTFKCDKPKSCRKSKTP